MKVQGEEMLLQSLQHWQCTPFCSKVLVEFLGIMDKVLSHDLFCTQTGGRYDNVLARNLALRL